MKKIWLILLQLLPVFLMIALIPLIKNDYFLTLADLVIIAIVFLIKYEKRDWMFLVFGFLIMIISESFFISTGVEKFERISLLGLMPLWLPVIWAYAFVAMKRIIVILGDFNEITNVASISESALEKQKNLEKARAFLKGKTKITNDDLQKELKVSDATIVRYLNDLEAEGLIKQVGKTGQSVYYEVI